MKVGDLVKHRSAWTAIAPVGVIVRFRNGYVCVAWSHRPHLPISEHAEDLEVISEKLYLFS